MPPHVKSRAYHSPGRAAQAARTRERILRAAQKLLSRKGYADTSVAEVACAAQVSVDTVYTSVGRKAELVLAVVDMVLGGSADVLPAEERDYVRAVRAAGTATGKIRAYAAGLATVMPEAAPLLDALRRAGESDLGARELAQRIANRRAANMLLFAADLRGTGELRADLDDRGVADIVWSTNAPEYYLLLVSRGWDESRYEQLLIDMWTRVLLER